MPIARKDQVAWLPGHYYHLYNRGAHCQSLFREEVNYHFVLRQTKKYCLGLDLSMIAYCLMPNHYHFLVRQNGGSPAGFLPQRIFNSYTKAFNNRYGHSGTLFGRRFLAKPIQEDAYLLHLCRYIHANPVKDGLVLQLEDWPYSNYLEWIGDRKGTLVTHDFIASHFSSPGQYQSFVLDYLSHHRLPDGLKYLESI